MTHNSLYECRISLPCGITVRIEVHVGNGPTTVAFGGWSGGIEDLDGLAREASKRGRTFVAVEMLPTAAVEPTRALLASAVRETVAALRAMDVPMSSYEVAGHSRGGLAVYDAVRDGQELEDRERAVYLAPAWWVTPPIQFLAHMRDVLSVPLERMPRAARCAAARSVHGVGCGCPSTQHRRDFVARWRDGHAGATLLRDLVFATEHGRSKVELRRGDVVVWGRMDLLVRRRPAAPGVVNLVVPGRHYPQHRSPSRVAEILWGP